MKILFLTTLAITSACMANPGMEQIPAPKSLEGLLKDAVKESLSHAQDTFDELSEIWGDIDWNDEINLPDVFGVVPCAKLCQVCWIIPFQTASDKCEDYCEDMCDYDFEKNDKNTRRRRSLIELCIGIGGSIDIGLGGVGDLLGSLTKGLGLLG